MSSLSTNKKQKTALIPLNLLIYGYIRNMEATHNYLIVPIGIKNFIIKYFGYLILESVIINFEEKKKLYFLLTKKWNKSFINFNLLYRASRDSFQSSVFHKQCAVANTLCILKWKEGSNINIFGGFTTQKWNGPNGTHSTDKNAFLYLLASSAGYPSQIFDIKPEMAKYAIGHLDHYLCFFGQIGRCEIWVMNDKGYDTGATNEKTYKIPEEYGNNYLLGNTGGANSIGRNIELVDIEVYQIKLQ
eukprot:68583_1